MGTSQNRTLFNDYEGFVEKFNPKKTTDDCYTPEGIYEVVADYVSRRYGVDRSRFVRPFYPGGDYERYNYPPGCVVVDNPPFSILSKIMRYYLIHAIRFFLFAPTLTALSSRSHVLEVNHIICYASITYENGAKVATSFVTNLDTDGTVLESEPELSRLINEKDGELQRANKIAHQKYEYPDNVIHAAKAQWYAAHGTRFTVNKRDCCPISALDSMGGKGIFGGGLLLSSRAAAERAAAERAAAERAAAERAAAIKWSLSEREMKMVEHLDKQNELED